MAGVFDRLYKRYDQWYSKNEFAYLSELEAVKKTLPEGRGLEIGVGTGKFASPLGIETGVDPSIEMLRLAKKRGVAAALARGEKLPFRDSSFDYVCIIIALCFVDDPQKVAGESFRVLKPGGKVVVGIVDKESFLGRMYMEKDSAFYKEASFFSVDEAAALFRKRGFTNFSFLQTVSKLPGEIKEAEEPKEGYGSGGFVVISAERP